MALLNYPNHPNVGDSAIWLGELEYLRRRRCRIVYRSDLVSHDESRMQSRLPPDGIILLHGGGNLGDIWPVHQRFREEVVLANAHNRVIIFPQTINFFDDASLASAVGAFGGHPDLAVVARDRHSYVFAKAHFDCRVELAPDSAFWLDLSRPVRVGQSRGPVWLSRTDVEAAGSRTQSPHQHLTVDWLSPTPIGTRYSGWMQYQTLRQLSRMIYRLPSGARPGPSQLQQAMFDPVARWHVERGCSMLGSGQVVITDRLHAHIISILLGIPQVLIDDAHLKVRHFWETWTEGFDDIVWAGTGDQAMALAARFVDR